MGKTRNKVDIPSYTRGYYAAIDDVLNKTQTIEEQGHTFRNILFQELMDLKPNEHIERINNGSQEE